MFGVGPLELMLFLAVVSALVIVLALIMRRR